MDAPPAYEEATGSSSSSRPTAPTSRLSNEPGHSSSSHLKVRNGIPPLSRRSMEDEHRPLPSGWIRQYDPQNSHQFFVDTNVDPPRSIWHHPYDDDAYMNGLSEMERERVKGLQGKIPNDADIAAESSEDDSHRDYDAGYNPIGGSNHTAGAPSGGISKFGRKMKDKMTNSTHEQREAMRREREAQERATYERHQHYRQAMTRALETGQPQFIGRDNQGREIYVESPYGPSIPPGQAGVGYNPYTQGPYANPNAKFIRPREEYGRPYGYGYGGGMGLPLMGGMMGGMMLGSMF